MGFGVRSMEFRAQLFRFRHQWGQGKEYSTSLSLSCKQLPVMHLPCPLFCPLLVQSPCLGCLLFHLPKFLRLFSSSAPSVKPSLVILALTVLPLLQAPTVSKRVTYIA